VPVAAKMALLTAARILGKSVRRLHLLVGFVTLAAFLASGMYMRLHIPPVAFLGDGRHVMFTSRHIYILAAALIHLMLGAYVTPVPARAGRVTQMIGSTLLVAAAVLLMAAFVYEPVAARGRTLVSALGLFALFGGAIIHVLAALLSRPAEPTPSVEADL